MVPFNRSYELCICEVLNKLNFYCVHIDLIVLASGIIAGEGRCDLFKDESEEKRGSYE